MKLFKTLSLVLALGLVSFFSFSEINTKSLMDLDLSDLSSSAQAQSEDLPPYDDGTVPYGCDWDEVCTTYLAGYFAPCLETNEVGSCVSYGTPEAIYQTDCYTTLVCS